MMYLFKNALVAFLFCFLGSSCLQTSSTLNLEVAVSDVEFVEASLQDVVQYLNFVLAKTAASHRSAVEDRTGDLCRGRKMTFRADSCSVGTLLKRIEVAFGVRATVMAERVVLLPASREPVASTNDSLPNSWYDCIMATHALKIHTVMSEFVSTMGLTNETILSDREDILAVANVIRRSDFRYSDVETARVVSGEVYSSDQGMLFSVNGKESAWIIGENQLMLPDKSVYESAHHDIYGELIRVINHSLRVRPK